MIELRDYQIEGLNAIFDYYMSGGKDNGVVAMPTGVGKSLIIAAVIQRALQDWPYVRIQKLVHSEEILEQNANKMWQLWPKCPLGIYHAGLRKRETGLPVIFAGIQSVYKKAELFGHVDILLVDEAHLIPDKSTTMYQQYIAGLRRINPNMIVVGFTATKYRMGTGLLVEGTIFSKTLIDLTTPECIQRFIAEGYLVPIIGRRPKLQIDVSNVKLIAGEFNQNQLEATVDKESITRAALEDAIPIMQNRQSILVFGTGNKHVEHICETLCYMGEKATFVHSNLAKNKRRENIEAFNNAEYRFMVNQNILLTGYDHPPIDGIIDLAPTLSIPRYVQRIGRMTRPYKSKTTGYYADYAGNRVRCGPFDNPKIPTKKGEESTGGHMPEKCCEECGEYHHIAAVECKNCGHPFPINNKLHETAADQDIMEASQPIVEYFDVHSVYYQKYFPKGKTYPTVKITYVCNNNNKKFTEFISLENQNQRARYIAGQQWLRRGSEPIPTTVDEALERLAEIRKPKRIRVWTNKLPYSEILSIEF